jgi:hypothetical protein
MLMVGMLSSLTPLGMLRLRMIFFRGLRLSPTFAVGNVCHYQRNCPARTPT